MIDVWSKKYFSSELARMNHSTDITNDPEGYGNRRFGRSAQSAGGYVGGTKTTNKYSIGDYWSMSIEQLNRSYMLHFYSGRSYSGDISARYYGRSVSSTVRWLR